MADQQQVKRSLCCALSSAQPPSSTLVSCGHSREASESGSSLVVQGSAALGVPSSHLETGPLARSHWQSGNQGSRNWSSVRDTSLCRAGAGFSSSTRLCHASPMMCDTQLEHLPGRRTAPTVPAATYGPLRSTSSSSCVSQLPPCVRLRPLSSGTRAALTANLGGRICCREPDNESAESSNRLGAVGGSHYKELGASAGQKSRQHQRGGAARGVKASRAQISEKAQGWSRLDSTRAARRGAGPGAIWERLNCRGWRQVCNNSVRCNLPSA